MFLKLVGACVVVTSSFVMGWYVSLSADFRRDDLISIKNLLTRFMSQLSYGNALLYEAALAVCDDSGASAIFKYFGEELKKRDKCSAFDMWQTSLKKAAAKMYINSADIREIAEIGKIFSYGDVKIQTKVISSVIDYADNEIKKLSETSEKNTRLYKSIGAAVGFFVVIVLF